MLDRIICEYRKLLDLIEEEKQMFYNSVQGELSDNYNKVLSQEYKKIEKQIISFKNFNQ